MEQILQERINAMSTSSLHILGVRDICVCACMYTLLPMLALLRAGASLTPSPVTATTHPALRQPSTMRSFWVGEVRAKTISWYPVRISSTLSSLISCKNKRTWMTHPAREHNRKEKDPAGIGNQDFLNTVQALSLLSQ